MKWPIDAAVTLLSRMPEIDEPVLRRILHHLARAMSMGVEDLEELMLSIDLVRSNKVLLSAAVIKQVQDVFLATEEGEALEKALESMLPPKDRDSRYRPVGSRAIA